MGFTYIGPQASQPINYTLDENIGGHIYTVTMITFKLQKHFYNQLQQMCSLLNIATETFRRRPSSQKHIRCMLIVFLKLFALCFYDNGVWRNSSVKTSRQKLSIYCTTSMRSIDGIKHVSHTMLQAQIENPDFMNFNFFLNSWIFTEF